MEVLHLCAPSTDTHTSPSLLLPPPPFDFIVLAHLCLDWLPTHTFAHRRTSCADRGQRGKPLATAGRRCAFYLVDTRGGNGVF